MPRDDPQGGAQQADILVPKPGNASTGLDKKDQINGDQIIIQPIPPSRSF